MSAAVLAPGDKVTWMVTSSTAGGSSFGFHTRRGVIESINAAGAATVNAANGRKVTLPIDRLRKAGGKSQVTEVFEFFSKGSTQEEKP
jgi:hypothetical protein